MDYKTQQENTKRDREEQNRKAIYRLQRSKSTPDYLKPEEAPKKDDPLLKNKIVFLTDAHRLLKPNDKAGIKSRDEFGWSKKRKSLTPMSDLYVDDLDTSDLTEEYI